MVVLVKLGRCFRSTRALVAENREFDSKRFNDFSSSLANFFTTVIVIALEANLVSCHQQTPERGQEQLCSAARP